jgi:hypothetical protein
MKHIRSRNWVRLILGLAWLAALVFGAAGQASAATILYVNGATGNDTHSGTSWGTAFKSLTKALLVAVTGQQVWVAKGIYTPGTLTTPTDPRSASFTFNPGENIAVYGGFAGTETSLTQRNWVTNVTVLSGNIGNPTLFSDNAYHVVTISAAATLDGFTIRGGNANGASSPDNGGAGVLDNQGGTLNNLVITGNAATFYGAGLWSLGGSKLTNVTISNNKALNTGSSGGGMLIDDFAASLNHVTFSGNSAYDGGGLFNYNSAPALSHVTFSGNIASHLGGGMYEYAIGQSTLVDVIFSGNENTGGGGGGLFVSASSPALTNVAFISNTAFGGGAGMYNYNGSSPSLVNVTFSHNAAGYRGGGMWNEVNSNPTLLNATFSGNTGSADGGGGMANDGSSPVLRNTTFSGNSASGNGDGIFNTNASYPDVANSIFWGDGSDEYSFPSADFYSGMPPIVDSIVQGGQPLNTLATNLISTDPKLGPLQNNGGFSQTMALGAGSSAIDHGGTDIACTATDQRGVARPQGAKCDIGAYEVRVMAFASVAAYDGWILESGKATNVGSSTIGPTSPTLLVGDNALNERLRSVLSFNTAPLPDAATVVRTKLMVFQNGHAGNAFATQGSLMADLANPYFGTGLGLVGSDWQAAATVAPAGTFGSTLLADGSWYTAGLNLTALSKINKIGTTQFRLRFTTETYNNALDYISLYSGDFLTTPADRPRLVVYYNP